MNSWRPSASSLCAFQERGLAQETLGQLFEWLKIAEFLPGEQGWDAERHPTDGREGEESQSKHRGRDKKKNAGMERKEGKGW